MLVQVADGRSSRFSGVDVPPVSAPCVRLSRARARAFAACSTRGFYRRTGPAAVSAAILGSAIPSACGWSHAGGHAYRDWMKLTRIDPPALVLAPGHHDAVAQFNGGRFRSRVAPDVCRGGSANADPGRAVDMSKRRSPSPRTSGRLRGRGAAGRTRGCVWRRDSAVTLLSLMVMEHVRTIWPSRDGWPV